MDDGQTTLILVADWQADGSNTAADELFRRYGERVLRFLRPRLSERLARRVDPDDVAQSVFNSFFRGVRAGEFTFRQRADVWRLLVQIAVYKLRNQARRHRAAARDMGREEGDPLTGALSREPTPDEAAAVEGELEACLAPRSERDRAILERFIHGEPYETISEKEGWSQRTVRRVCETFMNELQKRLAAEAETPDREDA